MARTRTHALPALAAVAMGALTLLASTSSLPAATPLYTPAPAPAPTRRLRIALYGAPARNFTAANASLFKSCGVTDAWIPYLQGAFAVDCCKAAGDAGARAYAAGGLHAGLLPLQEAPGLLATYRAAGIRPWFMERPGPDFEWTGSAGAVGPGLACTKRAT